MTPLPLSSRRRSAAVWGLLSAISVVWALGLSCNAPRTTTGSDDDDGDGSMPDFAMSMPPKPCEGLACFVANCPPGTETVVSGTVTAPNGTDPIREALVYIPTGGMPDEFPPQVSCEQCNSPVGGKPLALTMTDVDGSFELRRVPATPETPIVIQKGRFRKVVRMNVARCEKQGMTAEMGRLPKTKAEGNLPRMAVATGEWDSIECVLRHVGISDSEFSSPNQAGAVHLYDNESTGGVGAPGQVNVEELLTNSNKMLGYNIIFLNCSDDTNSRQLLKNPQVLKNLLEYVSKGGRLYVTDWSYDFIAQVPEFAPFICFNDDKPCSVTTPHGFNEATGLGRTGTQTNFTADVEQSHPGGKALARWLTYLPEPILGGKVKIDDPVSSYVLIRQMAQDLTKHPSTVWLTADLSGMRRPVSVTFDYPVGPSACGRVLYSSYHTREHSDHTVRFPKYCPSGKPIQQENVLEFLIFELSSCFQPPG